MRGVLFRWEKEGCGEIRLEKPKSRLDDFCGVNTGLFPGEMGRVNGGDDGGDGRLRPKTTDERVGSLIVNVFGFRMEKADR